MSDWRLPEGWFVRLAKIWRYTKNIKPGDVRAPDGTPYGKKIFYNGQALALGIKPIRKQGYDSENYKATPEETITPTEVIDGWKDIIPRMTLLKRKKKFALFLKTTIGIPNTRLANEMVRDLTDLDNADPLTAEWQTYKTDLKAAYDTIRTEVIAIDDYDELIKYIKCEGPDPEVEYGWRKYIPEQPIEEE